MIKYFDPYKTRTYARLQGDKKDSFFILEFKEAIIYQQESNDDLVLMADVTKYSGGILRSFKPENEITPSVCAIPVYSNEYEVKEKDDSGNWNSKKVQPSIFEQNLFGMFAMKYEEAFSSGGKSVSGKITFLPDDYFTDASNTEIVKLVEQSCKLEYCDRTDSLPKYEIPNGSAYKKGNGYSSKLSPDDKVDWLKKELLLNVKDSEYNKDKTLASIIEQFVKENENQSFLDHYFRVISTLLN